MPSWRTAASRKIPALDPMARAVARERAGDLAGAISAYEDALRSAPDNPDILASLAVLAARIEMFDVAVRLWEQVSRLDPDRLEAIEGRARAWRELGQFEPAVSLLRQALLARPQEARLWNSLGVTLMQDSQAAQAIPFFEEAVRLDGRFAGAVYNRGAARFDLGDFDAAAADFDRARALARKLSDAATIRFAAATLALTRGDLTEGWDAYDCRLSRHWDNGVAFEVPGRRWALADALAGRHLLLMGEQGLGDEIMFANLVPDVLEALGAHGRLSLAVEPRLADLFRRSFPRAQVSAHATDRVGLRARRTAPHLHSERPVDLWAPMGSMPRRFRTRTTDFPATKGYLRPDPARVAHWRAWLGDGPPAVGISWRSGKMFGDRRRQYPPPELWAEALATPGVRFVNIQYGDCAEALAAFRRKTGCEILEPPGLDIREDIDDLAALCAALDLIVCVANATSALAGACGLPALLIGPPCAWPRLGTDGFPWYPSVHAVAPTAFGAWGPAMAQAAGQIAGLAAR